MEHLVECQQMLEQLKIDYPLPPSVRFSCEFQSGTRAKIGSGRKWGAGLAYVFGVELPIQIGKIAIAMDAAPRTLERRLRTLAHEYRHMLQAFVLNTYSRTGRWDDPAEYDAITFAKEYVKDYMAKQNLK